jgi:spore coat protein U-like protein
MKFIYIAILAILISFLFGPIQAQAANCSGQVTDINFGTITVRSNVTNQTAGTLTVTCSGGLLSGLHNKVVGVCVDFGAGSGGAANSINSPRNLLNSQNTALAYELRPTGNGASNGTLNRVFVSMVYSLGGTSVVIPIYADVVSDGVGLQTGLYQSVFNADAVTLRYGVLSCDESGEEGNIASFTVLGNVSSSCEVDSTTLNFGNLASVIAAPVDEKAQITVRCTDATPFDLRLGHGNGPTVSSPESREMTNISGLIKYGLYQNFARTVPWGNTPDTDLSAVGQGADQSFTVYGRIHSGQTAWSGIYSDQVVITIEY